MKDLFRTFARPTSVAVVALVVAAALFAAVSGGATPSSSTLLVPDADRGTAAGDDHLPTGASGAATTDHEHGGAHAGHAPADVVVHAAAMALVDPSQATHVATTDGDWSSPATWSDGVPPAGSRVHIPDGITVTVDARLQPEIKTIGVDGTLRFATDVHTELRVDTLVTSPSGTFEVGTPDRPIAKGVTANIVFADDGPIDRSWDPSLLSRGALLHGHTVVHGDVVTHRTIVTSYPRAGDTSIRVAGPLEGWDAGDEIVITGTNGPTSDELRTITSVEGTTVHFSQPLARDHVPPAADLELYVANLTRNIHFSSENPAIERRGHFMVMHTLDARVTGARFSEMGANRQVA